MAEGGVVYTRSETGSDHRHSGLYSRHSRNYVENVSVAICTIMTRLGYGEEIRRWRVEKYRKKDRLWNKILTDCMNKILTDCIVITAGSKAEGLTSFFESDMDMLFILKHVLCVEAGTNLDTIPDDIDVFRMDTRVYPGHCILLQERPATMRNELINNSLCDNGYGDVLLSSCLWKDYILCNNLNIPPFFGHFAKPTGPSIPAVALGIISQDNVNAIPCHCPSILQRWAARPRHWPSPVIVQKVVSLGAWVTPVGHKGSDYKHMEWRICFNIGETELVNNLNETQAKVYVILKMILKDLLKPTNKEITSYVLKNIILWQAENTQPTEFHERSLLHWLHDGLRQLRTAIDKKQLCYYMIPERNLMAACGLEDALQSKWVADITDMMDEGPRVILRLEKIRMAIVASPEPMLWFSQKRMEVEILYLELINRVTQIIYENGEFDLGFLALVFNLSLNVNDVLERIHHEGNPAIGLIDVLNRLLM
ncbi:uncharacterized protein LOC127850131 isoform X1 [Dreissena polymorpha]|uniref:Mab-21-like HhH/H2TH-like domain-containing protein n=1 Tax=Dreissena polymorpha TaxID=45954 RepID=A0A9D4CWX9_DREPO|nr:uncharacterized protein LOC127850131 isoform X1 [Dreissena polymorpha]XP_052238885.1 uncharacterized protein LOC127850131 isoform X1 [Dreissena polymorpha]KAH3733579.1 hypothetical protein DPMN_040010 [Dreissena polymorpha]